MPRDNRYMYMAHVYFMSVVVTVWGSVGMFVVRFCNKKPFCLLYDILS